MGYDTFARSGNTFLRRFFETISGVETGASMNPVMTTMQYMLGMRGENIVDDRLWIIKSHHPKKLPGDLSFVSNKVICCVRNPLDVFPSLVQLINT